MAVNFVAFFVIFLLMRTTARPKIGGERGKEPQSKVFLAPFLSELQKCLKKQEGARRREKEVHLKGNKK